MDSKYFSLCRNFSLLTLQYKISHRQYTTKCAQLCSNKTSFMDTDIWISHDFHVSQKRFSFFFLLSRADLGSQQNGKESTESSHIPHYPHMHSLLYHQHPPQVWSMCYNWCTDTDTSLSYRVHSWHTVWFILGVVHSMVGFFFSIITVTIFSLCVYQFASIVSDCSSPGSSVHGILQARILQWVVMPSSRGSSKPRERTHLPYSSSLGRRVVYHLYYLASPSQFMH